MKNRAHPLWHWKIVCHLLFSGIYDAGHFDSLQNNLHTLKPYDIKNINVKNH